MDCVHIPQIGYGEFGKRLRQKMAGKRIPVSGSLELTFRCNLRCVHCYVGHGREGLPGQRELSAKEIDRIAGELVDEGALWFLLTGGEPMMRRDFREIFLSFKRRGMLITLFTNGTLVTERTADFLAEWQPHALEITLYGRTQATYEQITGVPGSHAKALRGIELLIERKVPVSLKTMVMNINRHELQAMQVYADSLGVKFRYDQMLNAGLAVEGRPTAYRLSPEEVVQVDLDDPRRMADWKLFCDHFSGVHSSENYLYVCGAGYDSFHIDPYGQISPCLLSRHPSFDLRKNSFHECWHKHLAEARLLPVAKDYGCNRCNLQFLCGQCPGWATMENADPQKPVEYLCQIAHLRSEAFGFH